MIAFITFVHVRRAIYILSFIISFGLGSIILVLSIGWFLALFGILLIPVMILHMVAGIIAVNRYPRLVRWSAWSWIAYVIFALARPDIDDVEVFSGLSMFLYKVGVTDTLYIEYDTAHFVISIIALVIMFILDILVCIRARRKKNIPPTNEYV